MFSNKIIFANHWRWSDQGRNVWFCKIEYYVKQLFSKKT